MMTHSGVLFLTKYPTGQLWAEPKGVQLSPIIEDVRSSGEDDS